MTQVKMGPYSLIWDPWGVNMSSLRLNPYFVCFPTFNIIFFGDSASYYWNNNAQWLCRNPDWNNNAGRKRHIPLYGAHKGSICLSNVNIQKFVCFLSIVRMSHSSFYFLESNMLTSYVGPLTQTRIGASSVTVPSMGPMRVNISFLSPNLEMCIHFLYSITIYNDSAFYFTEIIVLISWVGTPTQLRKRIGSITFHACVCVGGGGVRGGAGHDGSECLLYVKILKFLYIYFI